jgi:hypothetical protein
MRPVGQRATDGLFGVGGADDAELAGDLAQGPGQCLGLIPAKHDGQHDRRRCDDGRWIEQSGFDDRAAAAE